MGFPIRKFTDQSLFAAPHDLSQRTTSFIASQRQGIHRIPLRHLIALIANARRSTRQLLGIASRRPLEKSPPIRLGSLRTLPLCRDRDGVGLSKTSFASNASGSLAVKRSPRLRCSQGHDEDAGSILRSNPTLRPGPSTECVSSSRCHKRTTDLRGQRTDIPSSVGCRHPNWFLSDMALKTRGEPPPQRLSVLRPPSSVLCLVEPDGIEPTTSCLQSTRSPN